MTAKFLLPKLVVCFLCLLATTAIAQQVQWASEVIGFSSQRGEKGYSAKQVLGRPNKCPATGDSPCAWAPANDVDEGTAEEWIKVGFDKPQHVSQVAICENYFPGSVEKVILYDQKGVAHLIYSNQPQSAGLTARVMHVTGAKTTYLVDVVQIVLQPGLVAGQNEIDAIGISEDVTPIVAEINIVPDLQVGKKENLGPGINSPYDEVLPVISPDGKTLFIDRKNHPQNLGTSDNIWVSSQDANGNWQPVENIGPVLNNGAGSFVASVTPDGNTLLIGGTFKGKTPDHFGVWITRKTATGWSYPEEVLIKDFYTHAKYVEFCLSNDGRTIVLSLDRADSYGLKDLYVSFLDTAGEWSAPRDLGATINSASDEATPFLAADGKTLYFSSDGFAGYGSQDMFISRRLDDTWKHWSEPQNLGPQLNSQSWDAYYTVPASGEYAYFVSTENSLGMGDIYRVKLPESLRPKPVVLIAGKVLDAKTGKPINARIKYESLSTGKEVGGASTSPTSGTYKITLPAGERYGYRAEAPGYIAVSENLDVTNTTHYEEIQRNLTLVPIEKGQTVRLNNIFFETGKAELRPESFPELDRVATMLASNPTMEILIAGHTDNVGAAATNKLLSEARAKAVSDYLVSKGVVAARLKSAGYGDTKPVGPNATEEGRQRNRRVEFTITK